MPFEYDYVIVGGGLQGGLLVLALEAKQPGATVALVETAPRLGGNHIWCFHAGDVTESAGEWLEPLVVSRWPGYRVLFPGFERFIERPYGAITSDRLHAVVARSLATRSGSALLLKQSARSIGARDVCLDDGRTLRGRLVVDARGPEVNAVDKHQGYQKFLGLELELTEPHGLERPILMDARVEQREGFRFVYVLPMTERTLLVEDTYFSNSPSLNEPLCHQRLREYVSLHGYEVQKVLRQEEGVLPMPWRRAGRSSDSGPLAAGYRGGFFHPGTGYSFPVALRLAERLAMLPPEEAAGPALNAFRGAQGRQAAFCHVLNYALFCWFPPTERWHIFQRFYRLPLRTIERFYALRLKPIDMARLVCGRPPRGLSLRYAFTKDTRP